MLAATEHQRHRCPARCCLHRLNRLRVQQRQQQLVQHQQQRLQQLIVSVIAGLLVVVYIQLNRSACSSVSSSLCSISSSVCVAS